MFKIGSRSRSQSPETKCSVCLGDYKDKSYVPGCYHAFCFACIKKWASRNNVCPLCKASFDRIIHKVKSETNYKEYVINVKKPANSHDDYPFFFAEHSFPSSSTFISRFFRNNIQFQLVPPPTAISTSSLFEQTRVLRSDTSRRNIIISPISFSRTRNRRTRRPSHTVTIISDEENNTDTNTDTNTEINTETNTEINIEINTETNEIPEREVITLEDSIVTDTPTPSTSGLHQSPSTSQHPIIIDASDEEDIVEASNSNESVVFLQESKSKKGKVSSKLKKKSSIDVAVQVGSTQEKISENSLVSNVEKKDIKQKKNSKYSKMKRFPKKSEAESSSLSTDDDDLEVIQILSRKSSKKSTKKSVQTSTVGLNNNGDNDGGEEDISVCGVVSSSTGEAGDNDCIFLMSKNQNVSININDAGINQECADNNTSGDNNNNINSVDINVNTDIGTDLGMDLDVGNNEIVESCNNIDVNIAGSIENNIFVKNEDVKIDDANVGCLVDENECMSLKRKCPQEDDLTTKIRKNE